MSSTRQKRVPIPPDQRWKYLRSRWIPRIVFAGCVWGVVVLWQDNVATPEVAGIKPTSITVVSNQTILPVSINAPSSTQARSAARL